MIPGPLANVICCCCVGSCPCPCPCCVKDPVKEESTSMFFFVGGGERIMLVAPFLFLYMTLAGPGVGMVIK